MGPAIRIRAGPFNGALWSAALFASLAHLRDACGRDIEESALGIFRGEAEITGRHEVEPTSDAGAVHRCDHWKTRLLAVSRRGEKDAIHYARDHSVADGFDWAAHRQAAIWNLPEVMEAMRARMAKEEASLADLAPLKRLS